MRRACSTTFRVLRAHLTMISHFSFVLLLYMSPEEVSAGKITTKLSDDARAKFTTYDNCLLCQCDGTGG